MIYAFAAIRTLNISEQNHWKKVDTRQVVVIYGL